MTVEFTQDQLQEFNEAFGIFDKDQDGKVEKDDVPYFLRSVGINFSNEELDQAIARTDQTGTGLLEFSDLMKLIETFYETKTTPEDLMACFKVFLGDLTATIRQSQLEEILTLCGTPFTSDELKQLFFNLKPDDNGDISVAHAINVILGIPEEQEGQEEKPKSAKKSRKKSPKSAKKK